MIRMDGCFRLHSKVVRFWETCRSAPSSVRHPQAPENNPGTFHLLPKPGIFTGQIRSPSLALRASRSSRRHRKHVAQDMPAVHRSFLLIERNRRHADSPGRNPLWLRRHYKRDWRWGGMSPVASRPASRLFASRNDNLPKYSSKSPSPNQKRCKHLITDGLYRPSWRNQTTERHPDRSMSSHWSL